MISKYFVALTVNLVENSVVNVSYETHDVCVLINNFLVSFCGSRVGRPLPALRVADSQHVPPLEQERGSCVYCLLLDRGARAGRALYVGETESLSQRLQQHRALARTGGTSGTGGEVVRERGALLAAVSFRAQNKSDAREIETSLIVWLKRRGYFVRNDTDGRHQRFGGD